MVWFGADPGGQKAFGLARLHDDGSFQTKTVSCAAEAVDYFPDKPLGIGIDCPLWWSSGLGSDRAADQFLRRRYKLGNVMPANSLRGAALVQGMLLAALMRGKFPDLRITESHPKAVAKALALKNWADVKAKFMLAGDEPHEHERDALWGAIAAREGFSGRWKLDLSKENRLPQEQDPSKMWFGSVAYFWPDN